MHCGSDLKPQASTPSQTQSPETRKKMAPSLIVWAIAVLVVVAVGVMLLNSGSSPKSKRPSPASPVVVSIAPLEISGPLSASEMAQFTEVPSAALDAAGAGDGALPERLPAGTPLLVSDGKPEIVYIGAEFCPYCASER